LSPLIRLDSVQLPVLAVIIIRELLRAAAHEVPCWSQVMTVALLALVKQ
jgi:hypothetical protein